MSASFNLFVLKNIQELKILNGLGKLFQRTNVAVKCTLFDLSEKQDNQLLLRGKELCMFSEDVGCRIKEVWGGQGRKVSA